MQKDIRINGITLSSSGGNATSVDEDYDIKNISSNITLPSQTHLLLMMLLFITLVMLKWGF